MNVSFLSSISIITVILLHTPYSSVVFYLFGLNQFLAVFVVGAFTFLSAYKINKSKQNVPLRQFFKNRILKLYPMYVLAVFLFALFIYRGDTLLNLLIHLFTLQVLLPGAVTAYYLTIWYISLIFLYYIIFLVLRNKKGKQIMIYSLGIFVATFYLHIYSDKYFFSSMFFVYYFFFVGGIFYAKFEKIIRRIINSKFSLLIFTSTVVITFIAYINYTGYLRDIILIPLYTIIYILVLEKITISKTSLLGLVIKRIAFASYGLFLFHRPLMYIVNVPFAYYAIKWNNSIFHLIYMYTYGLGIVFGVSYIIQYYYSKVIRKIK